MRRVPPNPSVWKHKDTGEIRRVCGLPGMFAPGYTYSVRYRIDGEGIVTHECSADAWDSWEENAECVSGSHGEAP